MIDVKELRLGSYIYDENLYPQQVSEITNFNRVCFGSNRIVEDLQNCTPIPLTEELLLKCGFEELYSDSKGYIYGINGVKFLRCYFDTPSFSIETDENSELFDKPIDNLHQLQNLYFALTGKELKIEL